MANLVNGKISKEPIAKVNEKGEFERPDSGFRDFISPEEAAADRYHLYVSYACPWAHRTIIVRNLKKLDKIIDMSVSDAFMGDNGWTFSTDRDPKFLAEFYTASEKNYTGKVSVPVLWDKKKKTIVNNESSEIIRIFNSSFEKHTDSSIDLYPEHLQEEIDKINDKVYHNINNGVYRAGFAKSQEAYEEAYDSLFGVLDELEELLGSKAFLTGEYFTEADVRLFTTLIRFDPVYFGHFKCNKRRIADYKNLQGYMKSIYQVPEIKTTCHFDHIKDHYYKSHPWINPTGIVPKGPELDLDSAHGRGKVKYWLNEH